MKRSALAGAVIILIVLQLLVIPAWANDCGCGGGSGGGSGDSSGGSDSSGYGSAGDPAALAVKARDLLSRGNLNESLQAFNDSLALDPYNAQTLMGKGEVLFSLQWYPEAVQVYLEVVKISPSSDTAYFCLGNTYMVMGDFRQAIDAYERSLKIRPGNTLAEENLNIAHVHLVEHVVPTTPTRAPVMTIEVEIPSPVSTPPLSPLQTPPTTHAASAPDAWIGILSPGLALLAMRARRKKERENPPW